MPQSARTKAKLEENLSLMLADLIQIFKVSPTKKQIASATRVLSNGLSWIADDVLAQQEKVVADNLEAMAMEDKQR